MRITALSAFALLAACSSASPEAEAQADRLDNAAQESTPEAAAVLRDQAEAVRDNGVTGAPGDPGSTVQNAITEAGEAQAVPPAPAPQGTPQSKQAAPNHGTEKVAPPPKVDTK